MTKKQNDILILKNKYSIRVGFLPDIHAGSTRAVCTPTFHYVSDGEHLPKQYVANEAQLILYDLWERNIKLFKKYKIQHVFVVGDAFQGENYIEKGAFTFIPKQSQIDLAADLLEEVYDGCDKKIDFYVWSGTKYHEMRLGDMNMHRILVDELLKRGIPAKYMYQTSYVELKNKNRTRRLFVAHEAPTALVYPATLMSRDIQWSLQSQATGSTLPVDAIIRAHLHSWLHVDHSGKHAVQLPCWQGQVPYKATIKYFFKLQPTLGGAIMLMDEYGRLDFWGGSYPFGFTKEEKIKFHRLCVTETTLKEGERLKTPSSSQLEKGGKLNKETIKRLLHR